MKALGQTVNVLKDICSKTRGINIDTLEKVVVLAIEIAREGREGRRIGTLFVVSDSEHVMEHSRCLILDPLRCHSEDDKHIDNSNLRETVKELAQLDGAFVVSDNGIFISACRYINASSRGIDMPLGFGARHMAAASITKHTNAIAIVVSESSIVRVFDNGEMIAEILPELWLLQKYSVHLSGEYSTHTGNKMTVLSKK